MVGGSGAAVMIKGRRRSPRPRPVPDEIDDIGVVVGEPARRQPFCGAGEERRTQTDVIDAQQSLDAVGKPVGGHRQPVPVQRGQEGAAAA